MKAVKKPLFSAISSQLFFTSPLRHPYTPSYKRTLCSLVEQSIEYNNCSYLATGIVVTRTIITKTNVR